MTREPNHEAIQNAVDRIKSGENPESVKAGRGPEAIKTLARECGIDVKYVHIDASATSLG
jgi:hypothetical protein